jgi:hypothetical protein
MLGDFCSRFGDYPLIILFYTKGHIVVTMEVPANESESKSELKSRFLQYSTPLDRGSVGQFSPWLQRSVVARTKEAGECYHRGE